MKILYLTYFFKPDLSAGSFRNTPLAEELSRQLSEDDQIDIFSTFPNRYKSYRKETHTHQREGNISIRRIKVPDHKSGFRDQMYSFWVFYKTTIKEVENNEYDLVFASSGRLFTAYLGYRIAKRKHTPLYLDIRDIFVDTISDVIKSPIIKIISLPVFKIIEKRVFNAATHINLISPGFQSYFRRYRKCSYSYFTNGIDFQFTKIRSVSARKKDGPIIITYAGNIGDCQGLHKILPKSAAILGQKYLFKIIGDGGAKLRLIEEIDLYGLSNIELIDPVPREKLLDYYENTDYLFLHLSDYDAMHKVLPSKIFEYGATNKPIIAGVAGYASKFISENVSNSVLFSSENEIEFTQRLINHQIQYEVRDEFIQKYSRESLAKSMAHSIKNIV